MEEVDPHEHAEVAGHHRRSDRVGAVSVGRFRVGVVLDRASGKGHQLKIVVVEWSGAGEAHSKNYLGTIYELPVK